jgi:hypothetical protein
LWSSSRRDPLARGRRDQAGWDSLDTSALAHLLGRLLIIDLIAGIAR